MTYLSRRGFLAAGAGALTCARAMPQTPSCTLAAEQEVGPYYLDAAAMRQDITEGKAGLPVKLRVMLVDANRCAPISGAALDIWHCDALGVYSGFAGGGLADHPTAVAAVAEVRGAVPHRRVKPTPRASCAVSS